MCYSLVVRDQSLWEYAEHRNLHMILMRASLKFRVLDYLHDIAAMHRTVRVILSDPQAIYVGKTWFVVPESWAVGRVEQASGRTHRSRPAQCMAARQHRKRTPACRFSPSPPFYFLCGPCPQPIGWCCRPTFREGIPHLVNPL